MFSSHIVHMSYILRSCSSVCALCNVSSEWINICVVHICSSVHCAMFPVNRFTFFDNKKSSQLVKDVDCLSNWEVSNWGEGRNTTTPPSSTTTTNKSPWTPWGRIWRRWAARGCLQSLGLWPASLVCTRRCKTTNNKSQVVTIMTTRMKTRDTFTFVTN